MVKEATRVWAEISLKNLQRNLQWIQQRIGPGVRIAPVLKANAYGHGAVHVAQGLDGKVALFVVATLEEALELQEAGIQTPILIIGPLWHPTEWEAAVEHQFRISIGHVEQLQRLAEWLRQQKKNAVVHLQVDTGMNRTGVLLPEVDAAIQILTSSPFLKWEGIYSHFVASDLNPAFTREQFDRFQKVLQKIPPNIQLVRHMANSAALVTLRESHLDMVRPGLALYGWCPHPSLSPQYAVWPVMQIRARVLQVKTVPAGQGIGYGPLYRTQKEIRVATLGIGYADGFPRSATNRAEVLIHGKRRKVLGSVTMDLIMVEVDETVKVGDIATILGKDGDEWITVHDLATWAGTIPYEILVRVGPRVQRIYTDRTKSPGP